MLPPLAGEIVPKEIDLELGGSPLQANIENAVSNPFKFVHGRWHTVAFDHIMKVAGHIDLQKVRRAVKDHRGGGDVIGTIEWRDRLIQLRGFHGRAPRQVRQQG